MPELKPPMYIDPHIHMVSRTTDDYQSMREALTRRFNRWKASKEDPTQIAPGETDHDETWRLLPDLLMIDGGKGQLGVAVRVLEDLGLAEEIPVVGLAASGPAPGGPRQRAARALRTAAGVAAGLVPIALLQARDHGAPWRTGFRKCRASDSWAKTSPC